MSRSDTSGKGSKAYPRRGRNFSWFRRTYVKAARRQARLDLARGAEPQPWRHRHRALWDWL